MDKTVTETVIEELQDSLVLGEVTTAMNLHDDLGMDSLDLVNLELALSDKFYREINLGGVATVQDVIGNCEGAVKA